MTDERLAELTDEFELLTDWEERYRYVIELGGALEPLSDAERNADSKVHGCASNVWLIAEPGEALGSLHFRGDSDAHIVRGLIAILFRLYNDLDAKSLESADPRAAFEAIGLAENLSPQRSNGLNAMTERIRREARNAAVSVA